MIADKSLVAQAADGEGRRQLSTMEVVVVVVGGWMGMAAETANSLEIPDQGQSGLWAEALDESGKGRQGQFRGDGDNRGGSWEWTLCAPSSRFNPWKGRDDDDEKRPAQSLGDSPWKGKHCHESTDLVDLEGAWNGNHHSSRSIVLHHEERDRPYQFSNHKTVSSHEVTCLGHPKATLSHLCAICTCVPVAPLVT